MEFEYFIMPNDRILQAEELVNRRGISLKKLVLEQVTRLKNDPEFEVKICEHVAGIFKAMSQNERSEPYWPTDLLEAVAAGAIVCHVVGSLAEHQLLTMSAGELDNLDQLSKEQGRSYDQMLVEAILRLPQNLPLAK